MGASLFVREQLKEKRATRKVDVATWMVVVVATQMVVKIITRMVITTRMGMVVTIRVKVITITPWMSGVS